MISISSKLEEHYNRVLKQSTIYTKEKQEFTKILSFLSNGLKELTLIFKYDRCNFAIYYKACEIIKNINPDNLEFLTTKDIVESIIKIYPNILEDMPEFINEKLIEFELNQLKINLGNFK